jgi:uncharacterized membrane protein YeaQ/YmgE (transglycosylase-associated protein family)
MSFIAAIVMGGLAGWVAEKLMASHMGLLGNILLGMAGGFVGLAATGVIGRLILSGAGAALLIWVGRAVRARA